MEDNSKDNSTILKTFPAPSGFNMAISPMEEDEYQTEFKANKEKNTIKPSENIVTTSVIKPTNTEEIGKILDSLQTEEETKENTTSNEVNTPQEGYYKILAEDLVSKGINLSLPEDFKGDSEEEFAKVWENTKNQAVDDTINSAFENHPQKDIAVSLFNHIKRGGDINSFTENYNNPLAGIDIKTESGQERAVRAYLKAVSRMPEDKINAKIQRLKDSSTLEQEAEDNFGLLQDIVKERQTNYEAQEKQKEQNSLQERDNAISEIRTFIDKSENIKGMFDIKNKKEKQAFLDYMFKPAIRLENNQLVSKAYADENQEDLETYLALKYQRFKGFDKTKLEKQIKNTTVTTLADKLSNLSKQGAKLQASGNVREEDYLDNPQKTKKITDQDWQNLIKTSRLV